MRTLRLLAFGCALLACHRPAPVLPPQAAALAGHLSPTEERALAAIRQIHEPGRGLIQRLRESGFLADSAEWWVAGPPEILPFAGTWRGLDGVAEFQKRLGATMRCDTVEVREYLVSGEQVAAIFLRRAMTRSMPDVRRR